MKLVLLFSLMLIVAANGCRKRSSSTSGGPAANSEVPASGNSGAPATKGAFVPTPAVPADSPAAKAQNELDRKLASGNPQLQLQVLDELLQAWNMSKPNPPKSLEEFVQAGMLIKLPTPPPGKRFIINQKSGHVELANQ